MSEIQRPEASASRFDWIPFALIVSAAVAAWILVWPMGNFPLNDDWAYASSVRHLLEEGRFVLSDWSTPFDLIPILSGALLSKLTGFRYEILRLSTCLWAVVGIYFLHELLKEFGVTSRVRWLACLVLAFTPIHFLLAFSFHTDVPFLSLVLGALYFFERSERRSSAMDEFLASLFASGVLLTRQSGAVLFLSFILWRLIRRPFSLLALLRLGLAPVAAVVFYLWYVTSHPKTWAEVNYLAGATLRFLSSPGNFLSTTAQRTIDSLLYASLFCSPFLLLPLRAQKQKRFLRDTIFLAAAVALAAYMISRGTLPYLENIFHRDGLGTLTVYASHGWKPAFFWGAPGLWLIYTVLSGLSLILFMNRLISFPWGADRLRLFLVTAPLAASTLTGARYFDRYVLAWILMLLLSLAFLHRNSAVRWPAWAAAGFWVMLSVIGSRDYFMWNRAKWALGSKAVDYGLSPAEVANGFDWNAHWKFEANMTELKKSKPLEGIGEWEWEQTGPVVKGVISFSPQFVPAGRVLSQSVYRSPLAPRGGTLYLFGEDKHS